MEFGIERCGDRHGNASDPIGASNSLVDSICGTRCCVSTVFTYWAGDLDSIRETEWVLEGRREVRMSMKKRRFFAGIAVLTCGILAAAEIEQRTIQTEARSLRCWCRKNGRLSKRTRRRVTRFIIGLDRRIRIIRFSLTLIIRCKSGQTDSSIACWRVG